MKRIGITINGKSKEVEFTTRQGEIMERLFKGEKTTFTKSGFFVWKANPKELVGVRLFNGAMHVIRQTFNLDAIQEFKYMKKFIG